MPGAAQARGMIEKRAAKKKALDEKIAEAKRLGEKPPPRPSKAMRVAEELAESQWQFIIQSEEEALPAAPPTPGTPRSQAVSTLPGSRPISGPVGPPARWA